MKMQDYYNAVVRSLRDKGREIKKLNTEMSQIMADINANKYAAGYINTDLLPKVEAMKTRVKALKNSALEDVHLLTETKRAEINEETMLRGEDLTEDAKLFNCGISLTAQDIQSIVKRNSGNRTMINLAAKYARQHNLNTYDLYELADHSEEFESCEAVNDLAARYCREWIEHDEGFSKLDAYFNMPKGTAENL